MKKLFHCPFPASTLSPAPHPEASGSPLRMLASHSPCTCSRPGGGVSCFLTFPSQCGPHSPGPATTSTEPASQTLPRTGSLWLPTATPSRFHFSSWLPRSPQIPAWDSYRAACTPRALPPPWSSRLPSEVGTTTTHISQMSELRLRKRLNPSIRIRGLNSVSQHGQARLWTSPCIHCSPDGKCSLFSPPKHRNWTQQGSPARPTSSRKLSLLRCLSRL